MRRRQTGIWILGAVLLALLAGCGQTQTPPSVPSSESLAPAAPPDTISYEGTVFTCNGASFDLTERSPSVNSIVDCTIVSPYVIVEGHIGPKNGYYGIFNTLTGSFEQDLLGNHFIYRDDDVTTGVYAYWDEILTYDGTVVADCDLPESSLIYSLSFSEDGSAINAEIQDLSSETPRVVSYPLPSAN